MMQTVELIDLLHHIEATKTETPTLEVKSAKEGCPKRLYDTLSSFSNQDDGGIIVFGVNEKAGFAAEGVYDPHDLQACVVDQCKQMEPAVRPVFTHCTIDDKQFVAAEIPGIDIADRPCFYAGVGRIKGSYVRVGDSDEHMTEYEIYSYEAFRKKYEDELRSVERASAADLDQTQLQLYLLRLKTSKPNLAKLDDSRILELMSIIQDGTPTLAATMLFSPYPQAYFPQLCIIATVIPGTEMGNISAIGERFLDNRRIEGPLPDMLEEAVAFVRINMRTSTAIDPKTGVRTDRSEYPIEALREAVLNALIHRDYSVHTQGMPVQLRMYSDRIEIESPGGLHGRIHIDQLGKVQPDTRNPVIATAMETLGLTENRYSGIPTIQRVLREAELPAAEFSSTRGDFKVIIRKQAADGDDEQHIATTARNTQNHDLLEFCRTPRTRREIAGFLGMASVSYAMKRYVDPLVEAGLIVLGIPQAPSSKNQTYTTAPRKSGR